MPLFLSPGPLMNSIHLQLLLLQQITGQNCNSSVSLDSCLFGGCWLWRKTPTSVLLKLVVTLLIFVHSLMEFESWLFFIVFVRELLSHPKSTCQSTLPQQTAESTKSDAQSELISELVGKIISTSSELEMSVNNPPEIPSMHLLMCSASCDHECPSRGRFGGKQWQDCFAFRKARKWLFFCPKSCKIICGLFSKVEKKSWKWVNCISTPSIRNPLPPSPPATRAVQSNIKTTHLTTSRTAEPPFPFSSQTMLKSPPIRHHLLPKHDWDTLTITSIWMCPKSHWCGDCMVCFEVELCSFNSLQTHHQRGMKLRGHSIKWIPRGISPEWKGKWENEEGNEEWVE